MDQRSPRDGRVIEELGTYDPMIPETDARAILKADRIDYWLGVGAQPSQKVSVLIRKYGTEGTHLDAQKEAIERLSSRRAKAIEQARAAAASVEMPKKEDPTPAEGEAASGESTESAEAASEEKTEASAEAAETTESQETTEASGTADGGDAASEETKADSDAGAESEEAGKDETKEDSDG